MCKVTNFSFLKFIFKCIICSLYFHSLPAIAQKYSIIDSVSLKSEIIIADSLFSKGNVKKADSIYKAVIKYKYIDIQKRVKLGINDSLIIFNENNFFALIFSKLRMYDSVSYYYSKAIDFVDLNTYSEEKSKLLLNAAICFQKLAIINRSLDCYKYLINNKIYFKNLESYKVEVIYNNMISLYLSVNRYDSAFFYIRCLIDKYESTEKEKPNEITSLYYQAGQIAERLDSTVSMMNYYIRAFNNAIINSDTVYIIKTKGKILQIYNSQKKYDRAIDLHKRLIENSIFKNKCELYLDLRDLFSKIKQYDSIYYYTIKYIKCINNISEKEIREAINTTYNILLLDTNNSLARDFIQASFFYLQNFSSIQYQLFCKVIYQFKNDSLIDLYLTNDSLNNDSINIILLSNIIKNPNKNSDLEVHLICDKIAIHSSSLSFEVYQFIGTYYFLAKNYTKAEIYFAKNYELAKNKLKPNQRFFDSFIKLYKLYELTNRTEKKLVLCDSSQLYIEILNDKNIKLYFYILYYMCLESNKDIINLSSIDKKIMFYADQKQLNDSMSIILFNHIGFVYEKDEDLLKAEIYYTKALNIALKNINLQSYLPYIYNNLGNVRNNKDDVENSLSFYLKSLKYISEFHDNISPLYLYNNIAVSYQKIGLKDNALAFYRKAINIADSIIVYDTLFLVSLFDNAGKLYEEFNDIKKANYCFIKAGSLGLKSNIPEINFNSLFILAKQYYNTGNYDSSLVMLDYSIFKLPKTNFIKKSCLIQFYNYYALNYLALDKYNLCLNYIKKSLILNNAKSDSLTDTLSMESIEKSIDVYSLFETLVINGVVLNKLYKTEKDSLLLIRANIVFRNSLKVLSFVKKQMGNDYSKFFIVEKSNDLLRYAIENALILNAIHKGEFDNDLFNYIENNKAYALLTNLYNIHAKQFGNIPDSLINKEKELKSRINFLQTQKLDIVYSAENVQEKLEQEIDYKYFNLIHQYDSLIRTFENDYPQYYNIKYCKPITLSEFQKTIPEGVLIKEYFVADNDIFIINITDKSFKCSKVTLPFSFKYDVIKYINNIKKLNNEDLERKSNYIYKYLFNDDIDILKGINKIVIIPDNYLYKLPFETLIDSVWGTESFSNMNFIINKYKISYNFSSTIYFEQLIKNNSLTTNVFSGFAPINFMNSLLDFDSTNTILENQLLNNLPYSEDEIIYASKQLMLSGIKSDIFLKGSATERNFVQNCSKYNIIHLATHGIINNEDPSLSYLVFWENNKNDTLFDGKLLTSEIVNLNLKCNLAVLSSCESGIGSVAKGEGIMALSRSFIYAGARNVILSLWKVYDRMSMEFMKEFYKQLLDRKDFSEVLRNTKLNIIKYNSLSHPRIWSGFVLYGL